MQMSSSMGNNFKITVFGQSHSGAIGVVIDGIPAGIKLDIAKIEAFMARRAPSGGGISTARKEADRPEIVSGLVDDITCGAPICAVIANSDTRSKDYSKLRDLPRPMHADFAAAMKYNGANDIRGGGQFSGRLTAPLCFAGAVAMQLLERYGITIGAHISAISGIKDEDFDAVTVSADQLEAVKQKSLAVVDDKAGERMTERILQVKARGDSVGGIIECAVVGLPAGIGEPLYDGIENRVASAVFGIPAVKGIEFGAGFAAAEMLGSEHNDPFVMQDGKTVTETNRHGGILGGISSGMPILFKAAFKPTPSIAKQQRTVSLQNKQNSELVIEGRHDPCIVPRAVPCVEAAAAVAMIDLIMEEKGRNACRWMNCE